VAMAATVSATLVASDFTAGAGTLATNYNLPTMASGPGHITAITLTASIIGDPTKTYNGNTNAILIAANFSLTGVLTGETITVTKTTGTYNSKDVPSANTVTTSLAAGDFTAGVTTLLSNYVLPTTGNGPGHINKAHLTVTANDKTKVFDNTPYSPFSATLSGFVLPETDAGLRSASALSGAAGFTGDAISAYLPGAYTITPNAGSLSATNYDFTPFTNGKLAITYGTCGGSVPAILPPINSDGTSVYQRKGGSTIPVKFQVCDAFGNPISNPAAVFGPNGGATITMLSAVRGTVDTVNEVGVNTIPDAGFRYSGGQWIFNMATTNLAAATTYTFRINLAYGPASIVFTIGVK
jgi:hypothetical protein